MSSTPLDRIAAFERRLRSLEREVAELKELLAAEEAVPEEATPEPPADAPVAAAPPPAPVIEQPRVDQRPPAPPLKWYEGSHELRLSSLLGARALAWAGGIVTALGIVLFFALAVNRGWIGPGARVVLGALASAIVFAGGLYLRRRFGETYSALSAVGAGIAGGYATLLAAGPHYDLLPDWAALAVAAAIAGIGLVIALLWSSEFIAGLGLVGAMLAQIPIAWGDRLTTTGTGFAVLMFAVAGTIVVVRRWRKLLTISVIAVLPQVLGLAAEHSGAAPAGALAVAASSSAVLLAAAIGLQLRSERDLDGFPASNVIASGVLASVSAAVLVAGSTAEGAALLGVAAVYAVLAVALFFRRRSALSALLGAVALAIGAVAVADLLSGASLAIAWAAESAALGWLAVRIDDIRYQLGSLAYLLLALGHALVVDTPFRHLFVELPHPAAGVGAMVAVAVAAAVFAERCRFEPNAEHRVGDFASLGAAFDGLREAQGDLRFASALLAGLGALYATSLGLLELPASFAWNHVAVSSLLAVVPLGALGVGLVRRWRSVQLGAWLALALALTKVIAFDVPQLDAPQRSWAMLVVGAALLLAGFARVRLTPELRGFDPLTVAALGVTVPLGIAGPFDLLDGSWHRIDRTGAALLVVTAVYTGLAATASPHERLRDLSTQLWGSALLVLVVATASLLGGTPLAAVWAAVAVLLALLSVWVDEPRFQIGAAVYVLLATGHALILDSPPTDFFESNRHPASGAGAVAAAAAAALALALVARVPERLEQHVSRASVFAVAGVLATYAGSLVILELFEIGGGRIETRFERGHAAVSAVWGVLALLLLYLGLTRRLSLRLAGFALFGITLAKIFLYDLSTLSPVARALSFLAVGAVLLMGGFFYQRLSAGASDGGEATGS